MKNRFEVWQRVGNPTRVHEEVSGEPSAARESPLMDNWQRYLQLSPLLFSVCENMSSDNIVI